MFKRSYRSRRHVVLMATCVIAVGVTASAGVAATVETSSSPSAARTGSPSALFDDDTLRIARSLDLAPSVAADGMVKQDLLKTIDLPKLDSGYAGVATQLAPNFAIDYYSTSTDPSAVTAALGALGLKEYLRVVPVNSTYDELIAVQTSLSDVPGLGTHDSYSRIQENDVLIQMTANPSREIAEAVTKMAGDVKVTWEKVEALAVPGTGGGGDLTDCTAGFTVKKTDNANRGLSTAAHCDNVQWYKGKLLNFKDAKYSGKSDSQWHDRTDITWDNTVYDGINDTSTPYYRSIDSRATTWAVGDQVCKWGKVTEDDCGTIDGVNFCPGYVPSCAPNFVWVIPNGNYDMMRPGDSGGPVFKNSKAYGLMSGYKEFSSKPNEMIYMPVAYLPDAIGVQVLIN